MLLLLPIERRLEARDQIIITIAARDGPGSLPRSVKTKSVYALGELLEHAHSLEDVFTAPELFRIQGRRAISDVQRTRQPCRSASVG